MYWAVAAVELYSVAPGNLVASVGNWYPPWLKAGGDREILFNCSDQKLIALKRLQNI